MAKSKHRRKGKTRPRGLFHSPPPYVSEATPEEQAMEAAQNERFDAFLRQTGRTQGQLSHADWHDTLESREWRDWVAQHPLPGDEDV